jgi:hypothetical protein
MRFILLLTLTACSSQSAPVLVSVTAPPTPATSAAVQPAKGCCGQKVEPRQIKDDEVLRALMKSWADDCAKGQVCAPAAILESGMQGWFLIWKGSTVQQSEGTWSWDGSGLKFAGVVLPDVANQVLTGVLALKGDSGSWVVSRVDANLTILQPFSASAGHILGIRCRRNAEGRTSTVEAMSVCADASLQSYWRIILFVSPATNQGKDVSKGGM